MAFSFYKIKINRSDKLFSDLVREKAGWRCEYCDKLCRINGVWRYSLQASHYWTRNHWNTRYDFRNVRALCANCHDRMGEYRRDENGEYDLWVKELLGEVGYKKLKIDANTRSQFGSDEFIWRKYVKILIQEWKDEQAAKLATSEQN